MPSEEIKRTVFRTIEEVEKNGINLEYIERLRQCGKFCIENENEREYGLNILKGAKTYLNDYCKQNYGMGFWNLEKFLKKDNKKVQTEEIDMLYALLLVEAQNKVLDSYLLYLERKRAIKDRFYQPKRKQFKKIGVVDALQDMLDDKLDILSISMPPSTGKASRLSAKVLTPNGFVCMGDIKVGDEVISGNGNIATVLGVYPQGKQPTYRVTLDDGSSTEVSDNHLWRTQTRDDRRRGKKYRIATTQEMLKNFKVENGKRNNYSIDYVPRIEFEEKKFEIHPYVLGVLIGDGYLACTPTISNTDNEIIEKVNELLPEGYLLKFKERCTYNVYGHEGNNCKVGSVVTKALKQCGLYGCTSEHKFIPKEYLYASYEQRLWLLRGLLDTDGFTDGRSIEYSTTSEKLAKDVAELVHSIGGYCSINRRESGYKDKNGTYIECKDSYRVVVAFTREQPNPFYLSRKADKYSPRKRLFKRFIENIEYIGEEECQCIYISDPCHLYITDDYIITHNTTLEKFFHSGVMGWYPKHFNLFYSHSADITKMYYEGVLNILTDEDEYAWKEIFPECRVSSTNAKLEQICINQYKPFPNLQTTSVGSKNAGKVRTNKFLFVDDMIGGIEEALNKNILDKLWDKYAVDARQRKAEDFDGVACKELHIATRWSVHDVIGRLERAYEGNPRARFIAVPDVDPETGESNFDYDFNGFSKEFFADQALLMDEISYRCLYKNEPIEREGLLYHEEELRRYYELPEREPDAILGVCDTKTTGKDFMVLPCFYQYGNDFYLVDCVCDDSTDFAIQQEKIVNLMLRNNMQQCEFESNSGGGRLAEDIKRIINERGGRCNITSKPTETNKETRIIVNSDWIKKNCLFKSKEQYEKKTDYGRLMDFLLSYSVTGKNPFDDVPDCLANFALYMTRGSKVATIEIINNPFLGGYGYGY